MTYPTVRIRPGHDKRFRGGSPWLYSNEIDMDEGVRALEPGSIVRVMAGPGKIMGVAHFNPRSLIAARLLTRNKDATIDEAFIRYRLERALALRDRLYERPFYRLVHAEGDGLPGLVVDRYGEVIVLQVNSAGMQAMLPAIIAALVALLEPRAIFARNDSPVREHEGLELENELVYGELPDPVVLEENGLSFVTDIAAGQKTGWYFDQRDNRAFVGRLARDASVLDLYAYGGGFAANALAGGARSALAVDRSADALACARQSAERQGVGDRLELRQADVFKEAGALADAKARFDVVVADPPPFVPTKKDLASGLKGYRKLARLSAALVREPGFLVIGCCSHHVGRDAFRAEVRAGVKAAGRGGRVIRLAGAGPDHPIHPDLPETAYLKLLVLALD